MVQFEPECFLVLGWPARDGTFLATWALVLEEAAPDGTRLIARSCAAEGYPFFGLPAWLGRPVVRLVHFVMQRQQLLGIANRVELRGVAFDAPATQTLKLSGWRLITAMKSPELRGAGIRFA